MKSTSGFTLLYDVLIQKYDLMTALVYGKVHRYCEMREEKCFASFQTIASELGISRTTVRLRLAKLVEAGYLTKESQIGDTNVYRDAGKLRVMAVAIEDDQPARIESDPMTPEVRVDDSTNHTPVTPGVHKDTSLRTTINQTIEDLKNVSPKNGETGAVEESIEEQFARLVKPQIKAPHTAEEVKAGVKAALQKGIENLQAGLVVDAPWCPENLLPLVTAFSLASKAVLPIPGAKGINSVSLWLKELNEMYAYHATYDEVYQATLDRINSEMEVTHPGAVLRKLLDNRAKADRDAEATKNTAEIQSKNQDGSYNV